MPFKITFLSAAKPLTKTITSGATTNYPLVKNFTSKSHLVTGIVDLHRHITEHAAQGDCLLKGPITEEIKSESRAGMVINSTPTNWLVLDIDSADFNFPLGPISTNKLERLAAQVVTKLPHFMQQASYIVQASSSLGFVENKISLHLFFALSTHLPPTTLKRWITNLNFQLPHFADNLTLSKTGWTIKYTLDVCVADNSRIIYIAPPAVKDLEDPFAQPEDRILLITGDDESLDTAIIIESARENTDLIKSKTIKRLRKESGLCIRSTAKYASVVINGIKTNILRNPKPGALTPAYIARGYAYYNLDAGNSNSYYHPVGQPTIIYNFKDEPPFRWNDIDPAGYEEYKTHNIKEIEKANPKKHFAIISKGEDQVYKITHNTETNKVTMGATDFAKAGHFYREHGLIMPETINEWDVVFDPNSSEQINYNTRTLNTYEASTYIEKSVQLTNIPLIQDLEILCPTIHNLLFHVLGNGILEYDHFVNWLSFILQEKTKTNTCWFMWGTQGTGKGLLYNYVLKPLIGAQNIGFHLGSALEDKFDAWRSNKQLIVIDEFEMPPGKAGDRIMERIKNWTTETDSSVRDMQRVSVNIDSIEAYIFFSNKHTMIRIDSNDRRMNIAPRQEVKIELMPWFNSKTVVNQITSELQTFTNFILSMKPDAFNARQALQNEAKKQAADATKTQAQNFSDALNAHNMELFIDLLHLTTADIPADFMLELQHAQLVIRDWLKITHKHPKKRIFVSATEMAAIYVALTCTKNMTPPSVAKMLARHGIKSTQTSRAKIRGRYFKIFFNSTGLTPQELQIITRNNSQDVSEIIQGKRAYRDTK